MSTDQQPLFRGWRQTLLAGILLAAMHAVHAQGFNALASPPRFEVSTAPGTRTRQIV